MINCKQATDYISRKEEGKLSFTQRIQLWRHLAICSLCRLFERQNKIFINFSSHIPNHLDENLSAAQKQAIIEALSLQ